MARKINLKDGSTVRYPEEKDLQEILEKLSSNEVLGSTVIPKNASEADKIKYKLCGKILEYKLLKAISQKEMSEKLGLDEPETSRILHYKIERYSIERLLGYALLLYPKLTLEVLAA
jgi:predicted XRE-type DNA-binding protein